MSILSTLEKELGSLRTKREKQQKLVQDLTAPMAELERLEQQEAERRAAFVKAQAELDQLLAERADAQAWIDRLAPYRDKMSAACDLMAELEQMSADGYLTAVDTGIDRYGYNHVWNALKNITTDQFEARQAIVARTSKRIAELGGE